MREQFLRWGAAAAPTLDLGLTLRQYAVTEAAIRRGNQWMRGHLRRLRAEPGDDLLSRLVHIEDERARLTEDELIATAGLVLAAGFETTVNLIGTGSGLLIAHPDQRESLGQDPDRWRNAVEEILRYDAPVQTTGRICRTDTEVAGRPIRANSVVSIMIGGVNRDPAVFADPDRFDVTRANAREHLAFSGGVHFCLGAALARLEGQIALPALFSVPRSGPRRRAAPPSDPDPARLRRAAGAAQGRRGVGSPLILQSAARRSAPQHLARSGPAGPSASSARRTPASGWQTPESRSSARDQCATAPTVSPVRWLPCPRTSSAYASPSR
jgi:cytochrome P450